MRYEVCFTIEKSGTKDQAKIEIRNEMLDKGIKEFIVKPISGKRTPTQNNALHLYFTQLAEALNDAGYDIRKTLRVDVPWTATTVKELLWRPIQKAYLKKTSTTELNKQQDIDRVYDILNRAISEKCGVSVPFPSLEELSFQQYDR